MGFLDLPSHRRRKLCSRNDAWCNDCHELYGRKQVWRRNQKFKLGFYSADAIRTRGFYYFYGCFIFTELIAPPIASWSSQKSVWFPFGIGVASLLLCFPVLSIMPELDRSKAPIAEAESHESNSGSHNTKLNVIQTMKAVLHATFDQFSVLRVIFSSPNMRLSIPIFLVGTFRSISLRVIIQYTSIRFGWKLSQVYCLIRRKIMPF